MGLGVFLLLLLFILDKRGVGCSWTEMPKCLVLQTMLMWSVLYCFENKFEDLETCTQTQAHRPLHTHTCTHAHTHTHTQTRMRALMHARTHTPHAAHTHIHCCSRQCYNHDNCSLTIQIYVFLFLLFIGSWHRRNSRPWNLAAISQSDWQWQSSPGTGLHSSQALCWWGKSCWFCQVDIFVVLVVFLLLNNTTQCVKQQNASN